MSELNVRMGRRRLTTLAVVFALVGLVFLSTACRDDSSVPDGGLLVRGDAALRPEASSAPRPLAGGSSSSDDGGSAVSADGVEAVSKGASTSRDSALSGDAGTQGDAALPTEAELDVLARVVGARHIPLERPESLARTAQILRALPKSGKVVRVLVLGDSHIAADYITRTVRRRLQSIYGEAGRGFVAIDQRSHFGGRRLDRKGFLRARIVDRRGPGKPFGFSGMSLTSTRRQAKATYLLQPDDAFVDIYYQARRRGARVSVRARGERVGRFNTAARRPAVLSYRLLLPAPEPSASSKALGSIDDGTDGSATGGSGAAVRKGSRSARSGKVKRRRTERSGRKRSKGDKRHAARGSSNDASRGSPRSENGSLEEEAPGGTLEIVVASAGADFVGLSFETGQAGVLLDSVGPVGADAKVYLSLEKKSLRDHLRLLNPSLVIVWLGGNDALAIRQDRRSASEVERQFEALVGLILSDLESADCMLWAPMDAGERADEERIVTRSHIGEVRDLIGRVARTKHCAFWDTFAAMGGEGSFGRWYLQGLMNDDLVHPKALGGELIGHLATKALEEGLKASLSSKAQ